MLFPSTFIRDYKKIWLQFWVPKYKPVAVAQNFREVVEPSFLQVLPIHLWTLNNMDLKACEKPTQNKKVPLKLFMN